MSKKRTQNARKIGQAGAPVVPQSALPSDVTIKMEDSPGFLLENSVYSPEQPFSADPSCDQLATFGDFGDEQVKSEYQE